MVSSAIGLRCRHIIRTKPVSASSGVLNKLFSVKPTGTDWSETVLRLADIQAEIARVYDKGSSFDKTRLEIVERSKPVEGEELDPAAVEAGEAFGRTEFESLLNTEVEIDIVPLKSKNLDTLPAFNSNEIRAIRWLIA